jgi:hypothetical protein
MGPPPHKNLRIVDLSARALILFPLVATEKKANSLERVDMMNWRATPPFSSGLKKTRNNTNSTVRKDGRYN